MNQDTPPLKRRISRRRLPDHAKKIKDALSQSILTLNFESDLYLTISIPAGVSLRPSGRIKYSLPSLSKTFNARIT